MVAYGWESRTFYAKWMHDDDPRVIGALQGPELNLGSPLTPLSNVLLERVKLALKEQAYVERIKRHYFMSCEQIERAPSRWEEANIGKLLGARRLKVGRNEVCPCGSGKKFKRCCGA